MILGIETSCDETALALIDPTIKENGGLVAELVASQVKIHANYGGVVPEIAAREHLATLPFLLEELLLKSDKLREDILEVAVTEGPGLKGCLLMGSMFARGLASGLSIGVRSINHLEGHLLAPMMDNAELEFPYIALLVSGGHSEVVIVRGFRQYEVVSRTIDDAAGEAFDKSATMIGLNYPGGALLARLGDSIDSSPFKLPLVMKNRPEMSFSGLKTAVRCLVHSCVRSVGCDEYCIRTDYGYLSKELQAQLAHTIQKAIVEALLIKVRNHVRSSGLKRIGLTGGVAANRLLRAEIGMLSGVALYVPDIQHCTDNAAMIAYVASQEQRFGLPNTVAYAVPRVCSRWALEKLC